MQLLPVIADRIKGREQLLKTKAGRIALTKHDPLLFAYIYLPEHITADDGSQTARRGRAQTDSSAKR